MVWNTASDAEVTMKKRLSCEARKCRSYPETYKGPTHLDVYFSLLDLLNLKIVTHASIVTKQSVAFLHMAQ
jgi:hypothetical protein